MAGGILSFEMTGEEQVAKGLAFVTANLKNLTPFWREVFAPKYFASVQDAFATGGRARGGGGKFKGGAWQGLSPTYRIWKSKHYPGQPLLVREGDLRESLRWSGTSLGPQGVFEAHPAYVVAGTSVPYAKYHQSGTKNMPARPFLPRPNVKVFTPLMKEWIVKGEVKGFGD